MKYKVLIPNKGLGGFGRVDIVENTKGERLAMKTFQINNPAFPKHLIPNAQKRFINEAKYQGMIDHQNVVPVLESDLTNDPPSYIMPLAEASLHDDMSANRTLNGGFLEALMDILSGLEEMHSLGLYHRDLKPGNVLRFKSKEAGKRDFYAISDFGLMAITETNITTITQTGMGKGSDAYTAPEITAELKFASPQSDIYSVGCLLHDFVGTKARYACNEINESGPYGQIMEGCTRMDPKRRFKSVSSLRDAILTVQYKAVPVTDKAKDIIEKLSLEPFTMNEDEWQDLINFVDKDRSHKDTYAILLKVNTHHIDQLLNNFPNTAAALGRTYAAFIRDGSFTFEDCDGLAFRLEKFLVNCPLIDVKTDAIMALLYMGTSHNRFYVERKFVRYAGPSIEENLCRRICMELRIDGQSSCNAIKHLGKSVNTTTSAFHILIQDTIKEICK